MSDRRKVALVTGASYGIGAEIALELAGDGFDLAVTELSTDGLGPVLASLEAAGAKTAAFALDYMDASSSERTFGDVVDAFGTIDVLVNSAGTPGGMGNGTPHQPDGNLFHDDGHGTPSHRSWPERRRRQYCIHPTDSSDIRRLPPTA